jgi:hypothetical protein
MNDPPETTTNRHFTFHHARPQLVRIVPFKKTDGVVGFRADGAYMFTPFEV